MTKNDSRHTGAALQRIVSTPHLARAVPRLPAEVLHRVIEHVGLEDSGSLIALATPEQVSRLFDLDLWRAPRPGDDERFDPARFGVWLEVLVDTDVSAAATTVAAMDVDLVVAGLAPHVRVLDIGAVVTYTTLDGEQASSMRVRDDALRSEIGGYVVVARRIQAESWDAIVAVLEALASDHPAAFGRLMHGCRRLSNAGSEVDGLDGLMRAGEQAQFDVAVDREQRRDTQGFVTAAHARAFLQAARQIDLRKGSASPDSPIARAYLRDAEPEQGSDAVETDADAVAAVVELLHDAGVLPRAPRALLEGAGNASPLARIHAYMQLAHDAGPAAYSQRTSELAFLANALSAGTSMLSRPFTSDAASKAATAVCNLGLENWPAHWAAERQDLVSVFHVGWTVLHESVCMAAAGALIAALASLHPADDATHAELHELGASLMRHWRAGVPWHACDELDVIATLDTPTWAALLGLIAEYPVKHAAVEALLRGSTRAIDPSAFEFISENRQIAAIHAFLEQLPQRLRA